MDLAPVGTGCQGPEQTTGPFSNAPGDTWGESSASSLFYPCQLCDSRKATSILWISAVLPMRCKFQLYLSPGKVFDALEAQNLFSSRPVRLLQAIAF